MEKTVDPISLGFDLATDVNNLAYEVSEDILGRICDKKKVLQYYMEILKDCQETAFDWYVHAQFNRASPTDKRPLQVAFLQYMISLHYFDVIRKQCIGLSSVLLVKHPGEGIYLESRQNVANLASHVEKMETCITIMVEEFKKELTQKGIACNLTGEINDILITSAIKQKHHPSSLIKKDGGFVFTRESKRERKNHYNGLFVRIAKRYDTNNRADQLPETPKRANADEDEDESGDDAEVYLEALDDGEDETMPKQMTTEKRNKRTTRVPVRRSRTRNNGKYCTIPFLSWLVNADDA
jgi:hypothetical protein